MVQLLGIPRPVRPLFKGIVDYLFRMSTLFRPLDHMQSSRCVALPEGDSFIHVHILNPRAAYASPVPGSMTSPLPHTKTTALGNIPDGEDACLDAGHRYHGHTTCPADVDKGLDIRHNDHAMPALVNQMCPSRWTHQHAGSLAALT